MENVVLVIHLILALLLVGAVLLQRSEGGALGMGGGGGGGGGGVISGRSAANTLQKVTWGLAAAFIATSLVMTYYATQRAQGDSVSDRLREGAPVETAPVAPQLPELPVLPALPGAGSPEAPAAPQPPAGN